MSIFQERLREAMQASEITPSELARLTGITKASLSQYLNGVYEAKQNNLYTIAKALNCTPAYLMGWDTENSNVLKMNVGEYIKQLRIKSKYTQEELGSMIGVNRAAVQKWESGKVQNLKRETIKRLSEIFSVSPASFIDAEAVPLQAADKEEKTLLAYFRDLNSLGKDKALDYLKDLTENNKYTK